MKKIILVAVVMFTMVGSILAYNALSNSNCCCGASCECTECTCSEGACDSNCCEGTCCATESACCSEDKASCSK